MTSTEPLSRDVLERLLAHPSLQDSLTWTQVQRFIRFTGKLWHEILGTSSTPPPLLPQNICGFLSSVLDLEGARVQLCWTAFGDMILSLIDDPRHIPDDDLFRIHGHEFHLGLSRVDFRCLSKVLTITAYLRNGFYFSAYEEVSPRRVQQCALRWREESRIQVIYPSTWHFACLFSIYLLLKYVYDFLILVIHFIWYIIYGPQNAILAITTTIQFEMLMVQMPSENIMAAFPSLYMYRNLRLWSGHYACITRCRWPSLSEIDSHQC